MNLEITTISTKKFLLITLLNIPVIMFLSLGLALLTSIQWLVYLIIPLLGLILFFGQLFSKSKTKVVLTKGDKFQINELEMEYDSVIGYFVNDGGLSQTELCLSLNTNKTVQITGSSLGRGGKKFEKAINEIITTLKSKNSKLLELEYQDVYVRQTKALRPLIYIGIGLVIIMDLIVIYLLTTEKMKLPWQIFFANLLIVGLIPYLKKRNISNTKDNN
jgi:hypothetical protein